MPENVDGHEKIPLGASIVDYLAQKSDRPTETIYHLFKALEDTQVLENQTERTRVVTAIQDKQKELGLGGSNLEVIKHGIETKDKTALLWVLNTIQTNVHGTSRMSLDKVNEAEVERLLQGETIMVCVGTCTAGERIYINPKERKIFMSHDEKYGQEYRRNFARLFDLADDVEYPEAMF